MPRAAPIARSRCWAGRRSCGAALRWTAEGGGPHVCGNIGTHEIERFADCIFSSPDPWPGGATGAFEQSCFYDSRSRRDRQRRLPQFFFRIQLQAALWLGGSQRRYAAGGGRIAKGDGVAGSLRASPGGDGKHAEFGGGDCGGERVFLSRIESRGAVFWSAERSGDGQRSQGGQ